MRLADLVGLRIQGVNPSRELKDQLIERGQRIRKPRKAE